MPDRSPLLDLPYIQPSQAQKHVTHNEAVRKLDALVQLSVQTRALSTPPTPTVSPARYIVAAGAQGVWAGQDNNIAVFEDSSWSFFAPQAGWQTFIVDEDVNVVWDETEWRLPSGGLTDDLNALTLGINTSADNTNRLSVAADATLLTHAGDDHRLKVNKSTATDTASLLFQTDFTGHAEMGLTGSNDFALRVSADGTTFTDALSADATTGTLSAPAGIQFGSTTLNHYEEGVWTPSLLFGDDNIGMTYGQQTGTYLRIGNMVLLHCSIVLSQMGTSTGIAEIAGLPLPPNPQYYPGELLFVAGGAGLKVPKCQTRPGSKIQLLNLGPIGMSNLNDGNFTNTSNFRLTLMHML